MSAQPEQKLIGWKDGEPQYIEQPEQAPKLTDAGVDTNITRGLEPKGDGLVVLHQREWVGLTQEDRDNITKKIIGLNSCCGWEDEYAKAIETKLKEKNNAV